MFLRNEIKLDDIYDFSGDLVKHTGCFQGFVQLKMVVDEDKNIYSVLKGKMATQE